MVQTKLLHRSFSGGEIGLAMYDRPDDPRHQQGAALVRNMLPTAQGSVRRRPGTENVRETKDSGNKQCRIESFRYSSTETLILEMGEGYIRLHTNGGTVLHTTPITESTNGGRLAFDNTTNRITFPAAHGLSSNDTIRLHGDDLPTGLDAVELQTVYAIIVDTTTIQVSASSGPGAAIAFSDDGSGDNYAYNASDTPREYVTSQNVTRSGNQLDMGTTPNFQVNDPVRFTSTSSLPSGLSDSLTYYVVTVGATFIEVSTVAGGAVLTLASAGSGTHTAHYAYTVGDLVTYLAVGAGFFYVRGDYPNSTIPVSGSGDTGWFHRMPVDGVFEFSTSYREAHLFEITYEQRADVITCAHPYYEPIEVRRLGATDWEVRGAQFSPTLDTPSPPSVVATEGRTLDLASSPTNVVAVAGPPPRINKANSGSGSNLLAPGDTIRITGISSRGIADGAYVVQRIDAGTTNDFEIENVDGTPVTGATVGTQNGGTVKIVPLNSEEINIYKVTAVDENNIESEASTGNNGGAGTTNNLFIDGAYNTVTWSAVTGAVRYRLYKKEEGSGLFGLIGELDADEPLTFRDNGTAPDLGFTPPIRDDVFTVTTTAVTFDTVNDLVNWTTHGLREGDPVFFYSTQAVDAALEQYRVFFVRNPLEDTFAVSETPTGALVNLTGGSAGTVFGYSGEFPSAVAHYQQRRVFSGTLHRPQWTWMTRTGTSSDMSYTFPVKDSDRVAFEIAASEASIIRHVMPADDLMLLANSSEYRVNPINSDAITPSSIASRAITSVGASTLKPYKVNRSIVYGADRGGEIRELIMTPTGIANRNLSLRASHLFEGYTVSDSALMKAPRQVMWFVSSAGRLLSLTFIPEEQISAWAQHDTDGVFESCAVVQEGDEDRLYVVAKRTIDGVERRFIERMSVQAVDAIEDCHYVDGGSVYDGSPATTISGLGHLAGKEVSVLADGVVVDGLTVSTAGVLTLTTAASKVHVGLRYDSELQTLPASVAMDAFGRGHTKNVNQVWVRVEESPTFELGPALDNLTSSEDNVTVETLTTDVVDVDGIPPDWTEDGQLFVKQDRPLPLAILGMTMEVEIG